MWILITGVSRIQFLALQLFMLALLCMMHRYMFSAVLLHIVLMFLFFHVIFHISSFKQVVQFPHDSMQMVLQM